MKQVYDKIRQQWVVATPEEMVRQKWLSYMCTELQFPKELLVIERELKMLPHLKDQRQLPTRRIDILSYGKSITPLLLIECKAEPLTQEALDQVLAYNTFVQASYVAIVNASSILLRYNLACKRCEINRLPPYPELVEAIHG